MQIKVGNCICARFTYILIQICLRHKKMSVKIYIRRNINYTGPAMMVLFFKSLQIPNSLDSKATISNILSPNGCGQNMVI